MGDGAQAAWQDSLFYFTAVESRWFSSRLVGSVLVGRFVYWIAGVFGDFCWLGLVDSKDV